MPLSDTLETRQIRGGALDPVVVVGPIEGITNPVDVIIDPATAVIIHDADGHQANVDNDVHALVAIAVPHHEVHEGETFYVSRYAEDVADDASIIILLQVGATKEAHCTWAAACGGDAEIQVTENPTVNAAGTAMTEFNMNRHSTETATVVATHTPTVAGGTLMPNYMVPGGSGGNAVGGTTRQNTEWVLDINSDYVIGIFNRSGQARNMSLAVQWYEEAMA